MPISNPAKIAIGLVSVGGASGVSYATYSQLSSSEEKKDSFEKALGISVLSLTGTTDQTAWKNRYKEFEAFATSSASKLDSSLNKTNVTKWEELQAWCKNNKDNDYDKDDKKFKNFESFCAWKIGDKLTGHIGKDVQNTDPKWGQAHANLKSKGANKTLSKGLQTVLSTQPGNNKADQVAMHKWCTDNYKGTWKGDSEEIFKEVKEYCK